MKLTKVIIIVEPLQTLKKAFDTVDRHILLKKLEYYSFGVILNKSFASYLSSNRKHFGSLYGYKPNLADANCGVPQDSILGPLLFPIYRP